MVSAQPAVPGNRVDFRQVTTHPDVDLSPRLSPDGKWLAYVSRQTYNFDIWIQSSGGGRARQITLNKADDFYPVWFPDGKALAFVSHSSDAAGDIYRIRFKEVDGQLIPREEPHRITSYLGYDGYPTVSPDGKKIAFVSNRSGRDEVWFWNETTGKTNQLTFLGGTQPAWSLNQELIAFTSFRADSGDNGDIYLMNLSGPKPVAPSALWDERELPVYRITTGAAVDGFPAWSKNADRLAFLRFDEDTNHDGLVTPADRGCLWAADVFPFPQTAAMLFSKPLLAESFNPLLVRAAMALTSGAEQVMQPWYGADRRVYFTSDRGGNLDIWSVPDSGMVKKMSNATAQRALADEVFPLASRFTRQQRGPLFLAYRQQPVDEADYKRLCERRLAFERVLDYCSDDAALSAEALYEIGLCHLYLGRPAKALTYWHWLLTSHKQQREMCAYTELALLGLQVQGEVSHPRTLTRVRTQLDSLIRVYADQPQPASEAQITIGDLYYHAGDFQRAFREYSKVQKEYASQRDACAQSQLKMGDVFQRYATRDEVIRTYLSVIENYPEQRQWMQPARDRILELLTRDVRNDDERISRYREIVGQYSRFALLAAAAQLRIADQLYQNGEYRAAIREYELVESLFPALTEEVFASQMASSRAYLKLGENLAAFSQLQTLYETYTSSRPDLAEQTRAALLSALLASADQLKDSRDYELALTRYRLARDYDLRNLHAHRGYIECMYYLKQIHNAEVEYDALNRKHPRDNVLTYALGLVYSYCGTERAELYGEADGLDPEYLVHKSSATIARALSYDYTMVQAYLTISYNYEMMENYEGRRRAKPKPWYKKFYNTVTAPLVTLYRTLTFYEESRPKPYYERAIHELNKAIVLNDESKDPYLEAGLALNLANNYYNLGEFGFAKAYEFYHIKLKYDSTFNDPRREALIYEHMGHCALVTEDVERGPRYLLRAISRYQAMGKEESVRINTKRLALLYEIAHQYDRAIDQYQAAADMEQRSRRYDDLMRSYRSVAYNYLQLGEPRDAMHWANRALALIDQGQVKMVKTKANRVQIGFFGLYVPVPFVNLSSAFTRFTTADEKALLFTIIGESYEQLKDFDQAIRFLEKKIALYRERSDRWSESIFLNNVGYLYYLKGDPRQAASFFKRSLELSEKEGITQGIVLNSLSLGRLTTGRLRAQQLQPAAIAMDARERQAEIRLAAEKINLALRHLDQSLAVYARTRCQLLLLLAELAMADSAAPDQAAEGQIAASFQFLHNSSDARAYLDEALQVSREQYLHPEETQTTFALADLFARLGDLVDSYRFAQRSRKLALRFGVYDVVWQADVLIGDLIDRMSAADRRSLLVQLDPLECYQEAIAVMEAHPQTRKGLEAASQRISQRIPYQRALRYLLRLGDVEGALAFAERMRAKAYYDLVQSEEIELRKERHKVFFGNARFLHSQLKKLEADLMAGRQNDQITARQIKEWEQKQSEYNSEFEAILKQVRQEVPELETLIRIKPVAVPDLQKKLRPKDVLYFYALGDSAGVWRITGQAITYNSLPLSQLDLAPLLRAYGGNADPATADTSNVLRRLLAPVVAQSMPEQHIVIAADEELMLLPWAGWLHRQANLLNDVSVVSSLTAYQEALQKRRLPGIRLYAADDRAITDALATQEYALLYPVPGQMENSFAGQMAAMALADIVHLRVESDWRGLDPLQSRFGFTIPRSAPAQFSVKQLYQVNLAASLLSLTNRRTQTPLQEPASVLALERSALYSGTAAVLLSLWPGTLEQDRTFFTAFYAHLKSMPPAAALAATQHALRDSMNIDRFQLYGFGGMSTDEEIHYAEEGFETKVRRGHSAFDMGDWSEAIQAYEEALQMAEKQHDSASRAMLNDRLLESAVNGRLWAKAIEVQSRILHSAEEANDLDAMATAYNNLSYFYTQNREFEQGIAYKNRFFAMAQKYGLKEEEAAALRDMALIYERGGNAKQAMALYQQALEKYQVLSLAKHEAMCLRDLGRIEFLYLDHYPAALAHQQEALRLLPVEPATAADRIDMLQNLGLIYERMGLYDPALTAQTEALTLALNLSNEKLQGLSRQYMANLYWKMGDYYNALQQQQSAETIFNALHDDKLRQVALATRGLLALSLGVPEEALRHEQAALELAIANDDRQDQSTIYKNLATINRTQKKYETALAQLEQAARLDSSLNSRRGMAYNLRNLAALHLDRQETAAAKALAHDALRVSIELQDLRNQAQSSLVLAKAWRALGAADSCSHYLEQAFTIAERALMPEIAWRALQERAQLSLDEKNSAQAVESLFQAIGIIESMRSRIKVEDHSAGFMDDKLYVYDQLVVLLLDQNRYTEAWQVTERARSRRFLDLLGNRRVRLGRSQDNRLLVRKDSLQSLLQQAESELVFQMSQTDSVPAGVRADAETRVRSLRADLSDLLRAMAAQNPQLADLVQVAPPEVAQVQKALSDRTAMLIYHQMKERLIVFYVDSASCNSATLALSDSLLSHQVETLRKGLQRQLAIQESAAELYQELIKPFEVELASVRHIVIVPSNSLHYLPFNVLQDAGGDYMGLRWSLSLAPSSSVWLHCLRQGDRPATEQVRQFKVTAFGNPSLGDSKWDLPFAAREVKSLQRYFPTVQSYLNARATETAVKKQALSPLLLFSCHGEYDSRHPLMSALLLTGDKQQDGRLSAHEIMGLDLNAYLTVVSACETGLGTVRSGDEVEGLVRSFILAGSSSVVTSLWKVDDLATAVLIKRLFRYLAEGDSRAEALRKAQRVVFTEINPYPSYWAGFHITGDFR